MSALGAFFESLPLNTCLSSHLTPGNGFFRRTFLPLSASALGPKTARISSIAGNGATVGNIAHSASFPLSRCMNCDSAVLFSSGRPTSTGSIRPFLFMYASFVMSHWMSPGILHSNLCFFPGPWSSVPGTAISTITVFPLSYCSRRPTVPAVRFSISSGYDILPSTFGRIPNFSRRRCGSIRGSRARTSGYVSSALATVSRYFASSFPYSSSLILGNSGGDSSHGCCAVLKLPTIESRSGNSPTSAHVARAHARCSCSALASSILFPGTIGDANERMSGSGPVGSGGGSSTCHSTCGSCGPWSFLAFLPFFAESGVPVPTNSSNSS